MTSKPNTPTILHAVGGLCNRLHAILSFRAEGPLLVRWDRDAPIGYGTFADAFEPIEGVRFVSHGRFDVEAFWADRGAPDWSLLKPNAQVRAQIARLEEPYAAIHVRRTDRTKQAKEQKDFTEDSEFLAWIDKLPEERAVYVATDNLETQTKFREWLRLRDREMLFAHGMELKGREVQDYADPTRHSTLLHSVVDLFACVGAELFMGSGKLAYYSSFTGAIRALRAAKA